MNLNKLNDSNERLTLTIGNTTITSLEQLEQYLSNEIGVVKTDLSTTKTEIIDSYINRQNDLLANGIDFALVTDGRCWESATNQLEKGFRHLEYLLNFYMLKHGMLEEIILKVFDR